MTAATDTTRLENTTANLPIAYGSIAFYLGPQSDEYHTHKWTLYLRSPDPNFDLGKAISKVIFQLHPSFSVPTRELTEPPFEVTESGWGEFEASIRIVWRDEAEERSTIVSSGDVSMP
jgi:YEATS domain-containing protein 4